MAALAGADAPTLRSNMQMEPTRAGSRSRVAPFATLRRCPMVELGFAVHCLIWHDARRRYSAGFMILSSSLISMSCDFAAAMIFRRASSLADLLSKSV